MILSLGVNVLSTWLTSSQGKISSDSPFAQLLIHWPITLLVGISLFLLALLTKFMSRVPVYADSSLLAKRDREYMIERLQHIYGELSRPLFHGITRLELELLEKPEAVQNTVNLMSHRFNESKKVEISIVEVYAQAAQQLLILGEPGAGKSMLLYQLASYLAEQAKQDETLPLPIILPLSSWAAERPLLEEWIVEQFSLFYQVPLHKCQRWLQSEQIFPLLDGLDEVEKNARPACIAAINTYHHEHIIPLVVCSREEAYETASQREQLVLQNAVVVQPLTHEQVDALLAQVGQPGAALRLELKKNQELRNLATNPLWLNILLLTYKGTKIRVPSRNRELLQQTLFEKYVEHMVAVKGQEKGKRYSLQQTRTWLCWLARQMRSYNQVIFYYHRDIDLDRLSRKQRIIYILYTFLGTFILFLFARLILYFAATMYTHKSISTSMLIAFTGFLAGMCSELAIGLICGLFYRAAQLVGLFPSFEFIDRVVRSQRIKTSNGANTQKMFFPWRTLLSSLGLFSIVIVGVIFLLMGFLNENTTYLLTGGILVGIAGAMAMPLEIEFSYNSIFLILTPDAVVQRSLLYFCLWQTHAFAWHAHRFLEDACARVLLRRTEAGYSFIHQSLLEYFANLDVIESRNGDEANKK